MVMGPWTEKRDSEGYLQECQLEITVNPGLELNLNLEVQVETQPESVRLAAVVTAAALGLQSTTGDAAESPRDAAHSVGSRLAHLADAGEGVGGELGEGTATAAGLVLLALPGLLLALRGLGVLGRGVVVGGRVAGDGLGALLLHGSLRRHFGCEVDSVR